jgi:hypothetical protein
MGRRRTTSRERRREQVAAEGVERFLLVVLTNLMLLAPKRLDSQPHRDRVVEMRFVELREEEK